MVGPPTLCGGGKPSAPRDANRGYLAFFTHHLTDLSLSLLIGLLESANLRSRRRRDSPVFIRAVECHGDFELVIAYMLRWLRRCLCCARLAFALPFLFATTHPAAQIVKCTDPAGNITYQSGKCPLTTKTEPVDVNSGMQPGMEAAYAHLDALLATR